MGPLINIVSWSVSSVQATIPVGSASGKIVVTVEGQPSNGVNFIMDSVVSNFGQLSVTNMTSNSAVITFLTDGTAVASVNYATTAQELDNQTGIAITESGSARQVHSIPF